MASHDSALKTHRQNVRRREHNRQLRTRLRSALRDIRAAIDAVLKGSPVTSEQMPSMGCSIKWKSAA